MVSMTRIKPLLSKIIPLVAVITLIVAGIIITFQLKTSLNTTRTTLNAKENTIRTLKVSINTAKKTLDEKENIINELKSEDQRVKNDALQEEIKQIEDTFQKGYKGYENLLKLKDKGKVPSSLDKLFAKSLQELSTRDYTSASATLDALSAEIKKEEAKIVATFVIPENVTSNNAPPAGGFQRQKVSTPVGDYLVDIISADLNSTRVIVDTASDGTCTSNCPVASLGSYAGRSGAYAGINGPYFCPASYPACSGKENSFDTLLMNKNKVYFNSDNNVYSTVPAVIFSGGSARFVGASSQWGRDTGVDSVIASQPMLTSGGNRVFGGDGEPKREGKGNRNFIGATGSTVYIGVVHSASVAEVAHVLQTLGIANSLNLDSGGTTALWYNGSYKVGPGRDSPYGILFVRK